MNNNGRRPDRQGQNQPQYQQNYNNQRQPSNRPQNGSHYQNNQYIGIHSYPPVRHKSRRKAGRAAGLVLLSVIILVMLLVSVIIFAARCATGQQTPGGDQTSDVKQTTDAPITTQPPESTEPVTTEPEPPALDSIYDYIELSDEDIHKGYQVLVNYQNAYTFPGDMTLKTFYGNKNSSYKVRDTIVSFDLYAMSWFNDMMIAFEEGTGAHDLLVNSTYRTYDEQLSLYAGRVDQYGEEYAKKYVALPGYSEHHTGLAVDLTIYTDDYKALTLDHQPDYVKWLQENAHKFGFILRYPENKIDITKIGYENWHYRYIGKPHAYYMVKYDLCLEEYIDLLRKHNFGGRHLEIFDDEGNEWAVYYVQASPAGITQVPVPKYQEYELSGNNVDGYIVTVKVLNS